MAITRQGAQKTLAPFIIIYDGMAFIKEESVDAAIEALYKKHTGIYSNVEETAGGSLLVVGNVRKRIGKPVFEIRVI